MDEMILEIRKIAGKIGSDQADLDDACDAENYDFQVQTGLSEVVSEILDYNPSKLIFWFGYCLINCGLDPDQRIGALLDALEREVWEQLYATDESNDSEGR